MPAAYKVLELIGSSENSWEDAVRNIVTQANKSLRDLRTVEVQKLDAKIIDGKVSIFRAKVKVSFKFEE